MILHVQIKGAFVKERNKRLKFSRQSHVNLSINYLEKRIERRGSIIKGPWGKSTFKR